MSMYTDRIQVAGNGRTGARFGRVAVRIGVALAALTTITSCTSRQTEGTSPAYLVIDQILAASGAEPDKFGGHLASDVVTNGGIIADNGQATVRIALKDPGSASNPATPSSTNSITVTRYHVKFVRADGRNQQGVDVPYEFDGGVTFTASPSGASAVFTLVRVQAKLEAPLAALRGFGGAIAISTLAEITFYGTDQAGRPVSVTGLISVNFADWADPTTGGSGRP